MIGPSQGPLPDNIQHSQETVIHTPGGIRTRTLSKRAAADPLLRPRERWNRRVQCMQEGNTLSCFFWRSKCSTWQHTNNFCDYRILPYSFVSSSQWDIPLNIMSFPALRWTHLSLLTHYLYSFNINQLSVVFSYRHTTCIRESENFDNRVRTTVPVELPSLTLGYSRYVVERNRINVLCYHKDCEFTRYNLHWFKILG